MYPKVLRTKYEVDDYRLTQGTASYVSQLEQDIRIRLVEMMVPNLSQLIDLHRHPNYSTGTTEFYAELIAMSKDEFNANYGSHFQRRGISDGTMAIMQGGNWKIVSNQVQSTPIPKSKPTPAKNFDPSEYLRNRVMELQNDANK